MKIMNKVLMICLAGGALLLGACQTVGNTLTFTVPAPTGSFSASNQSPVVNVAAKDMRGQPEISSYVRDGAVFKLLSSPSVDALFLQAMQQNLNSKGVRIAADTAASQTNVTVNVKDFYAKVEQGNLRYKIIAKVQVEITVQGWRGNFTKNLGATRTQEGAFSADNDEIRNVLDSVFKETVSAIYADQEVVNAINQYGS